METIGVAEAKRRFAELTERVARGEAFIVARRGKPAVALVAPGDVSAHRRDSAPVGLAAVAGALEDWEDLDEVMAGVVASRTQATDRPAPELD